MYVANMLQNHHYSRVEFDDEISQALLTHFLEFLDFNHLYFTQADVDGFVEKYATELDDQILTQKITAAEDIYEVYETRVRERVAKIKALIDEKEFTFDSDRTVAISREEAPWPKDEAEADALWVNIIEADLLQEHLSIKSEEEKKAEESTDKDAEKPAPEEGVEEAAPGEGAETPSPEDDAETPAPAPTTTGANEETPEERVFMRYDRYLKSLEENEAEDVANYFLSSLSAVYDPHSEYFSQSELDNFRIGMDQRLFGIGALLSIKDGAAEIQGVVVGGPADRQGELQINDRIVGVAQGKSGEMVDVMFMKLQKIVELIRGEKDSFVRLKCIPAGSDDPSITKEIVIKRDEVNLKDKLANAELLEVKNASGGVARLGWINLSSFYADMEEGTVSTTVDVQRLLERLMKEGISGLVLDLRGNGGGSLEEAIKLTGLFIPTGPVVQSKDWRGKTAFRQSENPRPVYSGPLVVLTDKASASASEILAAALQDYRRALVVGESSTFGKGTVQTILPVSRYMPFFSDKKRAGALKVTIQKFYRIAGGSTQLRGVVPDLILPSVRDALEIGEGSLPNPLPYDEIEPREYSKWPTIPVAELKKRHEARIATNPEFQYTIDDANRVKERMDRNIIELNIEKRLAETEDNKVRRENRKQERIARAEAAEKDESLSHVDVYALNLDNVDADKLVKLKDLSDEDSTGMRLAKDGDEEEGPKFIDGIEPVKRETLNILEDLIELGTPAKTAAANP